MTVHFIGAGPGAADLITLRGHRLIAQCPVCLYAGSLVPPEIIAAAPPGALLLAGGLDHGHKGYGLALMVEALTQGLSAYGRADDETGWGARFSQLVVDGIVAEKLRAGMPPGQQRPAEGRAAR